MAHTKGLQKNNNENSMEWLPKGEKETSRSIPLTMSFDYKWTEGEVERKERCSLRGELMRPGILYDPQDLSCPTTEKLSVRLLFEMAGLRGMVIEHMEIFNTYLHKNAAY